MYFCTAGFQRFNGMGLGRTSCTAAAVPSSLTAQQDDNIAWNRSFSANVACRSCTEYRTDFHSLCHIARMVYFRNVSGCKTNLVPIRAVTACSTDGDFPLRQLAGNGIFDRNERICCTGYTHSLINIGTARQRVTDCTAEAGCSTTERFNFRRVVVGFVLEHQNPVFFSACNVYLDFHRTSIDFFAFVQIVQLAVCLELLHCQCCHIHEGNRLGISAQFVADVQVSVIGFLNIRSTDFNLFNIGGECGVTAVVRPVSVNHPDFRDGWVTVFGILEIILTELDVIQIHCQTVFPNECIQLFLGAVAESMQGLDFGRDFIVGIERFRLVEGSLPAFYRVNQIRLNLLKFCIGHIAADDINLSGANPTAFALQQNLNTLFTAVCPLVKLSRQVFGSKHSLIAGTFRKGVISDIDRWFRKNSRDGFLKCLFGQVVGIIAVQNPNPRNTQPKSSLQVVQHRLCFYRKFRLFFHINSINRHTITPFVMNLHCLSARCDRNSKQNRFLLF